MEKYPKIGESYYCTICNKIKIAIGTEYYCCNSCFKNYSIEHLNKRIIFGDDFKKIKSIDAWK